MLSERWREQKYFICHHYVLTKLTEPILLFALNENLAAFVTFHFALCLKLVYSNIVRTYETLLTYDLYIRNTDPRFNLVSYYKKHFLGLKWKMLFLISRYLLYEWHLAYLSKLRDVHNPGDVNTTLGTLKATWRSQEKTLAKLLKVSFDSIWIENFLLTAASSWPPLLA